MKTKECADCGEQIEEGRAKALPHVQTCVHCQRHREHCGQFKRHVMTTKTTYANGGEIEEMADSIVRGDS